MMKRGVFHGTVVVLVFCAMTGCNHILPGPGLKVTEIDSEPNVSFVVSPRLLSDVRELRFYVDGEEACSVQAVDRGLRRRTRLVEVRIPEGEHVLRVEAAQNGLAGEARFVAENDMLYVYIEHEDGELRLSFADYGPGFA